jgi:hypothetical protein
LKRTTTLKKLDVYYDQVDDWEYKAFSEALRNNSSLEEFRLGSQFRDFRDQFATVLELALAPGTRSRIKKLEIEDCVLRKGVPTLIRGLLAYKKLECLSVPVYQLYDTKAIQILLVMPTALRDLAVLGPNYIPHNFDPNARKETEMMVAILSGGATRSKTLKVLELSGFCTSDNAMMLINQTQDENPCLETVIMNTIGLAEEGYLELQVTELKSRNDIPPVKMLCWEFDLEWKMPFLNKEQSALERR